MHIPDGVLPTAVSAAGYVTTGVATWYSLRRINQEENPHEGVPKASLLTAAFFVASWIHIPIPPTSVHLVLNGLLGAILGYYAFPAILVGLFFQAVMFQHGGLTTLGVNATMMGLPALLAYYLFRLRNVVGRKEGSNHGPSRLWTGVFGFLAGAVGLGLATVIAMTLLITTVPSHLDVRAERASIYAMTLSHVPLMIIEGAFTALVATFLQRVAPRLLGDR
ncbi:MAG: cobalt transporter CbiM [Anaerolineae bacterium]|jgi:cobalt/nickel transport system permease protein